jgi:hypothetical protein
MLKKLPPALLLALGIELVATVTYIVWVLTHSIDSNPLRMSLVFEGASLATYVLAIAGLLELARATTGREALGLRITAGGFALGLAMMAFWEVVVFVQPHWSETTWDLLSKWANFAVDATPVIGLIVATSARHRTAAIAGVVVLLVGVPLPPLAKLMYGWVSGWKTTLAVHHGLHAAVTIATLALVARVAGGESTRAPDAATTGLRTIASALWLRVIAAVTVAGLTMLLVVGRAGEGSTGVLKLAMMSGAVVNVISLIMLARGALATARSHIADMPRWPLVASAAGTLWCLGVGIYQLPYTYRLLYGDHESYSFSGSDTQEVLQALSVAVPLVALGAIAVIATAIGGFAARRGLDQLRAEAQGKGAAFVLLMLVNVAIQAWLLPSADSLGSFVTMTLGAATAALWATVQMARLCTLASDSLHAEPPLPKATLV